MAMTDPLGDMLARIKNGHMRRKSQVNCPASKLKENVLSVLKREGFIRDYRRDGFFRQGTVRHLWPERLLNHGVIDPRDTRRVLGFCLATCLESRERTLQANTFGVARP